MVKLLKDDIKDNYKLFNNKSERFFIKNLYNKTINKKNNEPLFKIIIKR